MDSYSFRFLITETILLWFFFHSLFSLRSFDFSLICIVSFKFSIDRVYWTDLHETKVLMVVNHYEPGSFLFYFYFMFFSSSFFFFLREEREKRYPHRLVFSNPNEESYLVYTKPQDKRIKYIRWGSALGLSKTLTNKNVTSISIHLGIFHVIQFAFNN